MLKRPLVGAAIASLACGPAIAQGIAIDQLPPAASVSAADRLAVQQGAVNLSTTRRATMSQVLAFVSGALGGASLHLRSASLNNNYNIALADTGTIFDNSTSTGSITATLFPASSLDGALLCFLNINGNQYNIQTSGSDQINLGAQLGKAGGKINSLYPESSICLVSSASANQWAPFSAPVGVWNTNGLAGGFTGLTVAVGYLGDSNQILDPFPTGLPNNGAGDSRYCTTAVSGLQPGFTNIECSYEKMLFMHGDHTPGQKTSAYIYQPQMVAFGTGQKFGINMNLNALGTGDNQTLVTSLYYQGGTGVSGDEGGCGYCLSTTTPGQFHNTAHVSGSIIRSSGVNTTISGPVVGSQNIQTLGVVSSSGYVSGDWVEVSRGAPASVPGSISREAVQLTAVGVGTISGVFRLNQSAGATVTPATVLPLSLAEFANYGEGLYLMDDSVSYTTGSIASWVAGSTGVVGSGTAWSASMVSGDAGRPGCFLEDADNTTAGVPTAFAIQTVNSATSLALESSRLSDPPGGTYKIRPCAYILRTLQQATNPNACCSALVLETNTFPWTNGDVIETIYGPSLSGFGVAVRVNNYMPETSMSILFLGTETSVVAPQNFIQMQNIFAQAKLEGGVNQSTFINAIDSTGGGGIGKAMFFSGTDDFAYSNLNASGQWALDRYGINEFNMREDSFSKLQNARGANVGNVIAGAFQASPNWIFNTNPHVGVGFDINDQSGRNDNDLIRMQVNAVDKFRVRADGTILNGSFSTSLPGVYSLFQNNIPFFVAPTGTMTNNGAFTLGTALPGGVGQTGIFLNFPANAIFSGSASGWYCAVMNGATSGTVYTSTNFNGQTQTYPYVSGQPINCYGVGSGFVSTGPGAYTGVTGQVNGPLFTIQGNGGQNFSYRVNYIPTYSATADIKTTTLNYGGQQLGLLSTAVSGNVGQIGNFAFWSEGVQAVSVPVSQSGTSNIVSPGLTRASVNMTSGQPFTITLQMANASGYVGLEHLVVEELNGP